MIIIVGAGFSGLLLAYRLLQRNKNVLVLEKYKELGGRIYSKKIGEDQYIEGGAGVIREDENEMIDLLKEIQVPIHFWQPSKAEIIFDEGDRLEQLDYNYEKLLDVICKNKSSDSSFLQLIEKSNLSPSEKKGLIIGTSYTEILHGNSEMACNENDWDEILLNRYKLGKPKAWSMMIEALAEKIKEMDGKIVRMSGVDSITKDKVICKNKVYDYDQVVITCPYHEVKKIKLPSTLIPWKQWMNQNFFDVSYFRVYARFKSAIQIPEKVCTNGPVKKIIRLNDQLVMVAYTDGKDAEELNELYQKSKKDLKKYIQEQFQRLFGVEQKIEKIWVFYWKNGIGSWKPMKIDYAKTIPFVQNPVERIYFCGDTYSEMNGQLTGCIKSVERILENF
jgi:protoporphyrinogen oxidase